MLDFSEFDFGSEVEIGRSRIIFSFSSLFHFNFFIFLHFLSFPLSFLCSFLSCSFIFFHFLLLYFMFFHVLCLFFFLFFHFLFFLSFSDIF